MTSGLKIRNQAQQLVVHSESQGTECIGKATLIRVVQPYASGSGRLAGYSTHTFSSTKPVLWAIDLPVGKRVGIIGTSHANGLYTIGAYCGGNPERDPRGFDTQFAVDIWAFSTFSSASSRSGLLLRNSKGQISHDFSAPNMTFAVASGELSSVATVPAAGRLAAIGNSPYYDVSFSGNEDGGYVKEDTRQFLLRTSDNHVGYSSGAMFKSGWTTGNPPEGSTISDPSPFFVVDAQFLP